MLGWINRAPALRARGVWQVVVVANPPRPVVFVNPGSGPHDHPTAGEIAGALPGVEVKEVDGPQRLPDLIRGALQQGRSPIGVAGGDGTVRSAAGELVGTGTPMLVIPAGTRNHFARELGLDDLDAAAAAVTSGRQLTVSVGRVNGNVFVNNAGVGLYPDLVRRRERGRRLANLTAALELIRHGRPVSVEVQGRSMLAWLVFVGNGRYGDGFTNMVERESLDGETLDVRIVRADRRLARLRAVAATAFGRLRKSPLIECLEAKAVNISLATDPVDVALDGEVVRLHPPLLFESVPRSLAVLVPPESG